MLHRMALEQIRVSIRQDRLLPTFACEVPNSQLIAPQRDEEILPVRRSHCEPTLTSRPVTDESNGLGRKKETKCILVTRLRPRPEDPHHTVRFKRHTS